MKTLQIDVAIVGAGTAGLVACLSARAAGATAIVIEGDDYGTTCPQRRQAGARWLDNRAAT